MAMMVYVVGVLLFLEPLSLWLAKDDLLFAQMVQDYMFYLVWAGPALMFASGLSMFVRIDGNPKAASKVILLANGVNLVLDYIFIAFTPMGIGGAGLSTALGYIFGAMVVIPYLRSPNRGFRFQIQKGKNLPVLKEMLVLGTPKALNQCASILRVSILNSIIFQVLGSSGLSIMVVCLNILIFSGVFVNGTSDALLPIVGGFFGEKDYYGIRQGVKIAFRILALACSIFVLLLLLLPQWVAGLFGLKDPDLHHTIGLALRLFALYIPVYGANTLLQNLYTVTKREKLASIIALLDGLVFVVLFAYLYSQVCPEYLWLAFVSSGLSTFLLLNIFAKAIQKKESVLGILLLREVQEGNTWDLSLPAKTESVVELSQESISFCLAQGVEQTISQRLGTVIEEMGMSIMNENQKDLTIDILIRVLEEEVVLRFRDNGVAFDPSAKPEENPPFSTLDTLNKLADQVEYIQQLGFNSTILRVKR